MGDDFTRFFKEGLHDRQPDPWSNDNSAEFTPVATAAPSNSASSRSNFARRCEPLSPVRHTAIARSSCGSVPPAYQKSKGTAMVGPTPVPSNRSPSTRTWSTASSSRSPLRIRNALAASTSPLVRLPITSPSRYFSKP